MAQNTLELEPFARGYKVIRQGVVLGTILRTQEPSGRVAFTLGADRRRYPRTYRGRELAADAAAALYDLTESVRSGRRTLEQVVLTAWEEPPVAARNW